MKYPVDIESLMQKMQGSDEAANTFTRQFFEACNAAYAQGFEDGKAFTEVIANE